MEKKYGLIKPGEAKKPVANFSRPSIFADDSDSDEEPQKKIKKVGLTSEIQRKQNQILQEKALEEDPTVYQYDELYDNMAAKKQEEKAQKSEDKKPKYIHRLLATAEKRKIENERRIERQVQREREEEGEKFKDKEAFVTSSYRKKLEELRKAEEEEAREAYLESIGDVTKQGNLDGFYRHIYSQKLDSQDPPETKPEAPKAETSAEKAKVFITNKYEKRLDELKKADEKPKTKVRSYRRKQSEEKSDEETDGLAEESGAKKAHLENNLDADSDFSIDSSSSDEEEEDKPKDEKPSLDPPEFVRPQDPLPEPPKTEENGKESPKERVEKPKPEKKKEKVDIWKKRTVGEVFDAALQRYYERKAFREQMAS